MPPITIGSLCVLCMGWLNVFLLQVAQISLR